jgi:acyl dehydratase
MNSKTVWFDDIEIGQAIPSLDKHTITPAHLVRWSAASENWHPMHFDWRYATVHDALPDVVVNGSWKQHVMIQLLTDWVGENGWLWTLELQFRGMNFPGDRLLGWGRVVSKARRGAYGVVGVDVGLRNQRDEEGTPGNALLVLRTRGGPPVPYPFDAACLGPEDAIAQ